jgi:hypothetical protein
MVRWDDNTHGRDLRDRIARGEVSLVDLAPNTLHNLTAAHYPETIPQGTNTRQTVIQRMRRVLLRIRACLELGAGDLSERTQLEELEEDVHFVFR